MTRESLARHADALELWETPEQYNYEHFRTRHLLKDVQRTVRNWGITPGALAPEFELRRTDGGVFHLQDFSGPLLLRFGSFT